MLEANPFQHLKCLASLLRVWNAKHFGYERDVLEDSTRGNQLEVLEDEPDAAAIFLNLAARQLGQIAVR